MPFITSVERHGIEKGRIEGKIEGRIEGKIEGRIEGRIEGLLESIELYLDYRFGMEALADFPRLRKMKDVQALKSLLKAMVCATTIDEVRAYIS